MADRTIGKTGVSVFPLGLGAMRLPLKGGGIASFHSKREDIDIEASVELIRRAVDLGVNYIDTAIPYVAGLSEEILAQALSGGYRERINLATKATPWLLKEEGDFVRSLGLSVFQVHGPWRYPPRDATPPPPGELPRKA